METKPIEHVRVLSSDIGCRMIGTPGNQAASAYIAGEFQRFGLAVETLPFPCPAWSSEKTSLSVNGQAVNGQALPAYANTFSPACDAVGPLLPLGSMAELEAADLAGKILVLYGELALGPLSAKGFFFAGEQDLKRIARLEAQQPLAVLVTNPMPGMRWRLIEDPDFGVPSATVTLEVGRELVKCGGAAAHIRIAAHREEGSSAHVVARLPGTGSGRIVVCAHYDTKLDTPGAVDNACGVAALLALAERLARVPRQTALEFVAFSNEEYYTSPERDVYYQANGETFPEISAAINMDGFGNLVSATNIAAFAASGQFEALVEAARLCSPGVIRTDPWPSSNHYLFFSHGVPSVAISGTGAVSLGHTPEDSLEWVSAKKLETVVSLVAGLIAELDGKDPGWGRVQEG